MPLVVCETVAAITPHLRVLSADTPPLSLSGFAQRPTTLCGMTVAWDTRLPISAARCKRCLERAREIESGAARGPALGRALKR